MTSERRKREFARTLALAESGDLAAQYTTGLGYLYGIDTDKNIDSAIAWLDRAASKDHTKSMLALARVHDDKRGPFYDPSKAKALLERAAGLGEVDALLPLARVYDDKKTPLYDPSKAKALLERAAGLGEVEALYRLAWMCKHPPAGERPNIERAIELTREAANGGSRYAQEELGELYLTDKLPGEEEEVVLAWLKAARSTKAVLMRAQLYERQGRDGEAYCLLYRAAKNFSFLLDGRASAERERVLSALHRVQDRLTSEQRSHWRSVALDEHDSL